MALDSPEDLENDSFLGFDNFKEEGEEILDYLVEYWDLSLEEGWVAESGLVCNYDYSRHLGFDFLEDEEIGAEVGGVAMVAVAD